MGTRDGEGVRRHRARGAGGVLGVERQENVAKHPVRTVPVKEWFGSSRRVITGFRWDSQRREIMWEDGSVINPVTAKEHAEEEKERRDREAVQIALDLFSGTQSMGPVYRRRPGVEYVPLDVKEHIIILTA